MLYIAVAKDTNVFIGRSATLAYWDNGYPLFPDLNRAYIPETTEIYTVDTIPGDVAEYKCCYTPVAGFYENANYKEPNTYGIPDELLQRIKDDAVAEIEEAVANADE